MDASVLLLRALYPLARRCCLVFCRFIFVLSPTRPVLLANLLVRVRCNLRLIESATSSPIMTRTASRSTHTIHAQPVAPLIPYTHSHSLHSYHTRTASRSITSPTLHTPNTSLSARALGHANRRSLTLVTNLAHTAHVARSGTRGRSRCRQRSRSTSPTIGE
jgi:hypothetical protein